MGKKEEEEFIEDSISLEDTEKAENDLVDNPNKAKKPNKRKILWNDRDVDIYNEDDES